MFFPHWDPLDRLLLWRKHGLVHHSAKDQGILNETSSETSNLLVEKGSKFLGWDESPIGGSDESPM